MLKKILGLVTASVAALSILTGCTTANTSSGSALVSVSRVKQFVIPDKTTLAETRELLGTPMARTLPVSLLLVKEVQVRL